MKTNATNYEKVVQRLEVIEQENGLKKGSLISKISDQIDKKDEKHFCLVMVKKQNNRAMERYEVYATTQFFAQGTPIEKITKNYKLLGFSEVIVLHNPNVKEETADPINEAIEVIDEEVKPLVDLFGVVLKTKEEVYAYVIENDVDITTAKNIDEIGSLIEIYLVKGKQPVKPIQKATEVEAPEEDAGKTGNKAVEGKKETASDAKSVKATGTKKA